MAMEKKIALNILGCCVLRDTFGMHKDDGGYEIRQYVQIPSPISLVTESPLYNNMNGELDDTVFRGKSNFVKRNQILELKGQVWDYIGEKDSDYLILDCAEFRKNMLYFPMTHGWFTDSHRDLLSKYIDKGYIPEEYETVDPLEIDKKMLNKWLSDFCDKVLSLYDKEHIILFEIKAVSFHTDEKSFSTFSGKYEYVQTFNRRMKKCFDYVRSRLHGCHIIEFPDGVIGDTNHKWGKGVLHYVPEYYDYSRKAVDIITKNQGDRKDEEGALEYLKHNYEKIFRDKYMEVLRCNLEAMEKERGRAEIILKYEKFFKKY